MISIAQRLGPALSLACLVFWLSIGQAQGPVNRVQQEKAVTDPFTWLTQKRIAVLTGSAGDLAARSHFPEADFMDIATAPDAALAVRSRKVDAFIYDASVLKKLVAKNPGLGILDRPVAKLEIAAALQKGNTGLLAEVNAALGALEADGTLQQLKTKWIDAPDPGHHSPTHLAQDQDFADRPPLRIGTCAVLEPFTFHAHGQLTGFDIELGQMIGQRLKRPVVFQDMQFEGLIPALQGGKIDLALSNFNITQARKDFVDFSTPYISNDISVLMRSTDIQQATPKASAQRPMHSSDDFKDKNIGVLLGSVHDTYATAHYPNASILQYKAPSDLLLAVKSGKVDAAFYNHETLLGMLRQDPELALIEKAPVFAVPVGIGFNKTKNTLREQFNNFLQQIRTDGQFDAMVQYWVRDGKEQPVQIDNSKANGRLVIGVVSDKGLPFAIIKENRLVGFDIELAERFAAWLGKEPVFVDMEFGSLIAAVSTNKVDAIFSTLMITEERKKQIAFSIPYYELGASLFSLKKNVTRTMDATAEAPLVTGGFFDRLSESFTSNIIQEDRYLLILDGLKTTIIISIWSSILGSLLGALICAMRMSKHRILSTLARVYIALLRGIPVLVLLMIIFYVVFASVNISPVAVSIIAFGLNFGAYVAEIFRSGIQSIDRGQTEAGISLGFTRVGTFVHIILPQMIQRILPVYKGEIISLIKMTSIVGYIAAQDLTKAGDIIRSRTFDAFFPLIMIAILYFLIAWLFLLALEYLERTTDPKYKRQRVRKP